MKRTRALVASLIGAGLLFVAGPAQAAITTSTKYDNCAISGTVYKQAKTTYEYEPSGALGTAQRPLSVGFNAGNGTGVYIYKFEARRYDSVGFIDTLGTWTVNAVTATKTVNVGGTFTYFNPGIYVRIRMFNSAGTLLCTARVSA